MAGRKGAGMLVAGLVVLGAARARREVELRQKRRRLRALRTKYDTAAAVRAALEASPRGTARLLGAVSS